MARPRTSPEHKRLLRNAAACRRRAENPEKARAADAAYHAKNRDRCNERSAEWKKRNPDAQVRAAAKRRGDKEPRARRTAEEIKEYKKSWAARWRASNREAARLKSAKDRARNIEKHRASKASSEAGRKKRRPKWSDRKACEIFYSIASRVSACTGIKFHVDHIIPLKGRLVSGLHVPTNLRVLPAVANIRKYNRMEVA